MIKDPRILANQSDVPWQSLFTVFFAGRLAQEHRAPVLCVPADSEAVAEPCASPTGRKYLYGVTSAA